MNKSQRSNLILFVILAIFIFTPLRGIFQEFTSKIFSFSPSVEKVESRMTLTSYNWKLKGLNTENYNFVNAKDKVVFVNFWATWCPPCRAEMPVIQNLYDNYKDKVEFIFVTNENKDVVEKFLKKNNYNLPIYNYLSSAPKEMQVSSIPATYLINKKGVIVIHKVGAADWDNKKVFKLFDELLEE